MGITEFILKKRQWYVDQGHVDTIEMINQGLCDEFANLLLGNFPDSELKVESDFCDSWAYGSDNGGLVLAPDEYGFFYVYEGMPFCEHYGSSLPRELYRHITDLPCHEWVYYEGRHYDAEAPKGVRNFFDLPIMKRQIKDMFGYEY